MPKNAMKLSIDTRLTSRETQVLYYISLGYTSYEIGRILFISFHTVATHQKNMMQKLGARNKAHLVRLGMENDMITRKLDALRLA